MSEPAPSFTLRYRLGRLDVAAWVLRFASRFWLYWTLASAATLFLASREWALHRDQPDAATSAVLGGVLIFVSMWVAMLAITVVLATTKRSKFVGIDYELTFSDDGFRTTHQYGSTELKWSAIQKAAAGGRHLFLYVAANQAIVVPRRGVADDDAWSALVAFCRARVAATR